MSKNTLEEVEFEQTLNNFKTVEDLEFYKDHITDKLERLNSTIKIEQFKL